MVYSVRLVSPYSYLVFSFAVLSPEVEDASERRIDEKSGQLFPFDEEAPVLFFVLRPLKRNPILLAASGDGILLFYEEVMNDSLFLLLGESVVVGRANLCLLEHPFRRMRCRSDEIISNNGEL